MPAGCHHCSALWHLPKAHDPAKGWDENDDVHCTEGSVSRLPRPRSLPTVPVVAPRPTSAFAASAPRSTVSFQLLSEKDEQEGRMWRQLKPRGKPPTFNRFWVRLNTCYRVYKKVDLPVQNRILQNRMPTKGVKSSGWFHSQVGSTRDATQLFLSTAGVDSQALKGRHGHSWGQKA